MNVDPEQSLSVGVALLNFVVHPRTVKGLCTNQDDRHRSSVELTVNPASDRFVPLSFKRLPVGVINES